MSKLFVDPQKIDELILRMNTYTTEAETKQKQMKSYLVNLKTSWDDNHYKAFMQQYDEFDKLMHKAIEMSKVLLLPNLKNVKKYAEDYKNMGHK
jgi:uncharacterized protein YukE